MDSVGGVLHSVFNTPPEVQPVARTPLPVRPSRRYKDVKKWGQGSVVRDVKVSAGSVVAWLLWAAALAVFAVGWVIDSAALRALAIIVVAAASTATVRGFFVRQTAMVREAFELGCDAARFRRDDGDDGTTPMFRRQ